MVCRNSFPSRSSDKVQTDLRRTLNGLEGDAADGRSRLISLRAGLDRQVLAGKPQPRRSPGLRTRSTTEGVGGHLTMLLRVGARGKASPSASLPRWRTDMDQGEEREGWRDAQPCLTPLRNRLRRSLTRPERLDRTIVVGTGSHPDHLPLASGSGRTGSSVQVFAASRAFLLFGVFHNSCWLTREERNLVSLLS